MFTHPVKTFLEFLKIVLLLKLAFQMKPSKLECEEISVDFSLTMTIAIIS